MGLLELLLAGGGGRRERTDTYYECRRHGRSLSADADECPECGSGVAAYTLR
jgi:ribosomal protein L37E